MIFVSSLRRWMSAVVLVAIAPALHAQTSAGDPDVPAKFTAPTASYDYIKREVMIPMRDGVKLHTVIVVPKGAKNAPMLLTRTPYNAAKRAEPRRSARTCSAILCRRATRCSSAAATSASSRTCAASTDPKASM